MGKEHEQKPNELETQGEAATLVANAHQSKRQGIGVASKSERADRKTSLPHPSKAPFPHSQGSVHTRGLELPNEKRGRGRIVRGRAWSGVGAPLQFDIWGNTTVLLSLGTPSLPLHFPLCRQVGIV